MIAIIETAKEYEYSYEEFSSMINNYIQYNKGTPDENILRKIYSKYIFKGKNDIEDLKYNISELINNIETNNDIEEIESIINDLISVGKIDEKTSNYLLDILENKRKEIL